MNGKQKHLQFFEEDYNLFCAHVKINSKLKLFILDDFSITLNETRFASNLLIGMATYFESDVEHYCLEAMINNCGVAAGKLTKNLTIKEITESITGYINNCGCDLSYKNHFLNVYDGLDSWIVVLHTSFPFAKNGLNKIPGLYPYEESYFHNNSILFKGKFGNYHYLLDEKAKEYRNAAYLLDIHSKKNRSELLINLFPDINIFFNRSHVNIPKEGLVCLGCYYSNDPDILIITEAPSKPMYYTSFSNFIPEIGGYIEPHGTGINFEWSQYKKENNYHIFKMRNRVLVLKDLHSIPRKYNTIKIKDSIKYSCALAGNI